MARVWPLRRPLRPPLRPRRPRRGPKGIEAAKKYGQAAVKAILKEFNAENMTALPEDKRAEFLVKLEGLGGENA